jgi:hypothetical protein
MQPSQLPRIKKPKLLRSNPLRLSLIRSGAAEPSEILFEDEDVIIRSRWKQEIVTLDDDGEPDLSDEIKWKLFLARTAAMLQYRAKWG